jgi:DNA-binding transcriptional LysR family regulator
MLDFRLKVFYTVAQTLNFNKAAEKLFISQPAVTKHIHELEQHFGITLFNRKHKRISLTNEGEIVKQYAHTIFDQYQKLDFELNLLKNKTAGTLRIGASTTIAQYIIPPVLALFHKRFPDVTMNLNNANSHDIEHLLQTGSIDLGIVEGINTNTDLKYLPYMKDEIVLVTSVNNKSLKKDTISIKDLDKISLIMREDGSGTFDIIKNTLRKSGFDPVGLKIEMQLGSTEAIKNYLIHSNAFAFLSVYGIRTALSSNKLQIIDIKELEINHMLSFAYKQGQPLPLAELFIQFASLDQ